MQLLRGIRLGFIFSCVCFASAQPLTITMWDFFGGGAGGRMEKLVEDFNASQDQINVKKTTLEWGVPFYTKVQTSAVAGQLPDVVSFHLSRFPSVVPGGLLRPFSDEELSSVDLSKDDFFPLLVEKASSQGQLYGIPLDTHPYILYYNKDLLREAGLLNEDGTPQGIGGIEGFSKALQQIKDETGQFGLAFPINGVGVWRVFSTFLAQLDGNVVVGDSAAFGEKGQRALQTMTDWVEAGLTPPNVTDDASIALFTGGRAAFMFNGVWNVPTMEDATAEGQLPFEYGVMPIPQLFDNQSEWADSHAFAIPNSSKNPISEEKVQAVLEFVSFVVKNSLVWADGGLIPAYLPVINTPEYEALKPNINYAAAAETVAYDPDITIAGAAGLLEEAGADFLAAAVNGQLPVDRALELYEQQINQDLQNSPN